MSHKKYQIHYSPSCSNCKRLRRSKRVIEGDPNDPHSAITMYAPSVMEALAAYYCDNYWFGSEPDKMEMLCGGSEYLSVYNH